MPSETWSERILTDELMLPIKHIESLIVALPSAYTN